MLFVNDERIDLRTLDGYKGNDYVLRQLSTARQRIKELGYPIKFKCDSLEKGYKEGKKGIYIPYIGEIETDAGSASIVYAQSARSVQGGVGVNYKPRGEAIRKTWTMKENDLDKILFLMVACPLVKTGLLYIEDTEAKAQAVANKRKGGSALLFYLYNEHSPIFSDEEKLVFIASSLGVSNPLNLGLNELKNVIFEKIESAEKIHDGTFGYKWFNDAMTEFTPLMTALRDVQVAVDKKIIRFNDRSYRWMLLGGGGDEVRIICPVEPAKTSLRREILANHLLKDKEVYNLITGTVEKQKKEEDVVGDVNIARDATDQVSKIDFATLEWSEIRSLAAKSGILIKGKKKEDLVKELELRRETI